jgi:catechol 2,3-dioxygenase-like lactoylglutathione lyase family enzyme
MKIIGFDHVQVAMPEGREESARDFYGLLLGLPEIPKPEQTAGRGGVWYQCGRLQLHLGVDPGFHPARKAHPALLVEGYGALLEALERAGYEVRPDKSLPDVTRAFTFDPFGNRIELISADSGAQ